MAAGCSELTIVLHEGSTDWLTEPKGLLSQLSLSTGVTRAQLFETYPGRDDTLYVRALGRWQQEASGDVKLSSASTYQARLMAASESGQRRQNVQHDLDDFLALDVPSLIMLPIIIDDRWWGFIRLDDPDPSHLWEYVEIEALEQVVQQIGERIEQQKLPQKQMQLEPA